jgi:hypothetical protein
MKAETAESSLPRVINEESLLYRTKIHIGHTRTCHCPPSHLNCMNAKEWIKSQLGVWQFNYETFGASFRD